MASEIPVTQARAEFADLVNRVVYGGERIVVTRHGKPIAALVPAADLDRLDHLEAQQQAQQQAEQSGPTIVRLHSEPTNEPIRSQPSHTRRFDIAAQHRPPGGRPGSGGPGAGGSGSDTR
jgi:prevent-host-death family protein